MAISIHLVAALWAILAGSVQLLRRKGTASHRLIGRTWMAAMVIAALSSFFIKGVFQDVFLGYSAIHLLSVWVLFCVPFSLISAIRHDVNNHKRFAIGAFVGTFVAGVLAFLSPERLLYQWLFT